jgi:hypothetical protein
MEKLWYLSQIKIFLNLPKEDLVKKELNELVKEEVIIMGRMSISLKKEMLSVLQ